jgi:hypothetical protein
MKNHSNLIRGVIWLAKMRLGVERKLPTSASQARGQDTRQWKPEELTGERGFRMFSHIDTSLQHNIIPKCVSRSCDERSARMKVLAWQCMDAEPTDGLAASVMVFYRSSVGFLLSKEVNFSAEARRVWLSRLPQNGSLPRTSPLCPVALESRSHDNPSSQHIHKLRS